jgi:transcription factor SPN1
MLPKDIKRFHSPDSKEEEPKKQKLNSDEDEEKEGKEEKVAK